MFWRVYSKKKKRAGVILRFVFSPKSFFLFKLRPGFVMVPDKGEWRWGLEIANGLREQLRRRGRAEEGFGEGGGASTVDGT
jgi:hypothetical protein